VSGKDNRLTKGYGFRPREVKKIRVRIRKKDDVKESLGDAGDWSRKRNYVFFRRGRKKVLGSTAEREVSNGKEEKNGE